MEKFEPFDVVTIPKGLDPTKIAKTNIQGILDSYHGSYDFMIELCQNAVDAIDLKFNNQNHSEDEKPKIEIIINEKSGIVRVSDNGIGMGFEAAKVALCPNNTDKPYILNGAGKRSLRGHKGVGLTFLAFAFNLLKYHTRTQEEEFSGEIAGGRSWVDSDNVIEQPKVVPSSFSPEFLEGCSSGASFEVLIGADYFDDMNITWLGWHFIIRCFTAVGYCDINELYKWNKEATITFKLIDKAGNRVEPPENYSDSFKLEYLYPDALLKACDIDVYHKKYANRTEPPADERNKYEALFLKWDTDKIETYLFSNGNIEDTDTQKYQQYLFTKNHYPTIYALFTHSQKIWKDRLDTGYARDKRKRFWKPGIQVITNQMPTGLIQEISLKYRASNADRLFMLVELNDAKPDYGRKGFKAEITDYIQFIASRLIIDNFIQNRALLKPTTIAHGDTTTDAEASADKRIQEASDLTNLKISMLSFKKEPKYEQDVIALFFELLGREYIKGFEFLSVSSGSQYDAVVNYCYTKDKEKLIYHPVNNCLGIPKAAVGKSDLIKKNLEFKVSLGDLIRDFANDSKNPINTRFAVTWDEGDIDKLDYFEIVDLLKGDNYEKRRFHGETHQLVYPPSTQSMPVIMLKYVIDILSNNHS